MIDLYSIKPIDAETLFAAAEATQGRLVTAEDADHIAAAARKLVGVPSRA